MAPTPTIYFAHTAPINPPSASPRLTHSQVIAGLNRKVRHAEDFVGGAILSTTVLSESKDEDGNDVVEREVVFAEGNRKAAERVIAHGDLEHVFIQPDGSTVHNIISYDDNGDMLLTFTFAWKVHGGDEAEAKQKQANGKAMASKAVNGTISAIRKGLADGTIKE